MTKEQLEAKYESILNDYYYRKDVDKKTKLERLVDKVLVKLRFVDIDNEDFYSLADAIFFDVLKRYDDSQDFNGFLYSCLMNKFKTEMTKRNRQKRQADKDAISLETPISDKEGSVAIGDIITNNETIEDNFFKEEEGYSDKMKEYLERLSLLQREVLRFISIGFTASEIIEELHITNTQYVDCYNAIHSYRNIAILL